VQRIQLFILERTFRAFLDFTSSFVIQAEGSMFTQLPVALRAPTRQVPEHGWSYECSASCTSTRFAPLCFSALCRAS
jgi:hypothetical protein